MDLFASYESGLEKLLARLGSGHPRLLEALSFQSRMRENIAATRSYGDTEALRAARAEIVAGLNGLVLETLQISFNDLCGLAQAEVGTPPPPTTPKRDKRPRVSFNSTFSGTAHGPVHMGQGDINVNGVQAGTGDDPAS